MSDFTAIFDFCRDLYPNEVPIPLHAPRFLGNEKKYLADCIDSTYVSYVGEFVTKFERRVADFVGLKHAISTCNGTVGLHLALKIAGVEAGDEVLLPSLTFVAAANAVSHAGASCVFVDADEEFMGVSPEKLESFLTQTTERRTDGRCFNKISKRTIRACLPVHIFGHPARVRELAEICDRFGIKMIEDASEALGSFIGERHSGTFGQAAVISFNGNKTVTTGGGGMLVTNDDDFAAKFRHLATTSKVPHAFVFYHDEVGYNYRMPNLNAAVGFAQMEKIDNILKDKTDTANRYREFFAGTDYRFIDQPHGTRSNFWLNAIQLSSKAERDSLLTAAVEAKIQVRPIWKLMHHLPMYSACQRTDMTTSEKLEATVVNLPSSVKMTSA